MELNGLPATVRLHRYAITKDDEDKCDVALSPQSSIDVSAVLSDRIQPMSIVVYSTYSLDLMIQVMIVE